MASDYRMANGLTMRFTYVCQKAFELAGDDPTSNSSMNTANPMNWDGEKGESMPQQIAGL